MNLGVNLSYRNKIYICFDGDLDIHYYRLMCAWKQNDGMRFHFQDAHEINYSRDDSLEESIKRQLLERLKETSAFVVLIGEKTRYLHRFVRWEMEQAIKLKLPIIGVNLNGIRRQDLERCPPIIRDELVVYISFNASILQYSLEQWPSLHKKFISEGKVGSYYFKDEAYKKLKL